MTKTLVIVLGIVVIGAAYAVHAINEDVGESEQRQRLESVGSPKIAGQR
jgi:hypothetical protein